MSQILDQILVEDIAKYCPQKFIEYHQCIHANREIPMACLPQQQDLATCIRTEVPAFQSIISECGALLQQYQGCLQKNISNQFECAPQLKQIRECASRCVNIDKDPINKIAPKLIR